jgi:gas vesicle protein
MSDERGHSTGTLLLAFAGAVVAALTSPKSGPEMRESLKGLSKDGRARRAIDRVAQAARGAFDEVAGGGA